MKGGEGYSCGGNECCSILFSLKTVVVFVVVAAGVFPCTSNAIGDTDNGEEDETTVANGYFEAVKGVFNGEH